MLELLITWRIATAPLKGRSTVLFSLSSFQLHQLVVVDFQAPDMLPEVVVAHPLNQLHKTLAYHLQELPNNKSILTKVEKEFPALLEYVMQV